MQLTTFALGALAAAPLASAVGSARVVNKCPFPVTLWSVGADISPAYTLAPGSGSYNEVFRRDPQTGGISIKITKEADGLFTGRPQTNFAYSLDGNDIWYDLSDVFGDAFAGSRLDERSANAACGAIFWANGTPPAGSQTKKCNSDADVTLTLCA